MSNVIFAEQTIDGFTDSGMGHAYANRQSVDFTIAAGTQYKVVWDGTEHLCTAKEASSEGITLPILGNAGILVNAGIMDSGDDTGEPFVMYSATADILGDEVTGYFTSDIISTSHTVAIYTVEESTTYDIVLKDRDGNNVNYEGVEAVKLMTADGEYVTFSNVSSGSGGGDEETISETKPIRFYDPYGNLIYSYSRAEIKEMTELPEGPALGNLTFSKWTHTLAELQSEVYFADVGPMYQNSSGQDVSVMIIETVSNDATVKIGLKINYASGNQAIVDWGDETTTTVRASSSSSSPASAEHSYADAGIKIITVYCTVRFGFGMQGSSYCYGAMYTQVSNTSITGTNMPDYYLLSILSGTNITSLYGANSSLRLRFVSLYEDGNNGNIKIFFHCPSLKVIAGRIKFMMNYSYMFYGASSLKRFKTASGYSFGATEILNFCDSIKEIVYGNFGTYSSIKDNSMNSKWAMLMTTTTPPTISAENPQWGTYPIYVPDEAVETYKTAEGWSTASEFIFPQSAYPDK